MFKSERFDFFLLLLLLLLALWQLPMGCAMLKWDAVDVYLPWKFYITEMLAQGQLPLWNPSLTGGFAQMGDTGTWYPISWLLGFAVGRYNITALHIEFLLHLYIAALGIYFVGKQQGIGRDTRLMAALSYALSGFFVGNAQHIGWLVSAAWLPWMFLFFNRLFVQPNIKDALSWATVLFLMISGGYPGIFIVTTYLFIGIFAVYAFSLIKNKKYKELKKYILYLFCAFIFFLGCAFVLLVSVADLMPHINRSAPLELAPLLSGALPLVGLVSFIFPFATSINDSSVWLTDFSMVNCYIGIYVFISLLFSFLHIKTHKIVRPYFLVGLFFLMIAMGTVFPFRQWLSVLPGMNIFRFPALFRLFAIFFLVLAFAKAWELVKIDVLLRRQFAVVCMFASMVLAIFGFWQYFSSSSIVMEYAAIQGFIQSFLLGIGAVVIYFLPPKKMFAALVFFDLLLATQLNFFATVAVDISPKPINNAFALLPPAYGIPSLHAPLSIHNDSQLSQTIPGLWRSLAIFHKFPSADGFNPYVFRHAENYTNTGVYAQVANRYPLFFLSATNSLDSIELVNDSLYSIDIKEYSANHALLIVDTKQPANLVFLQNYYPHWRIRCDNGEILEPQRFFQTFMSVNIPKGKHTIEWDFCPIFVKYAFGISLLFWIFVLFWILIKNRQIGFLFFIGCFFGWVLIRVYLRPNYTTIYNEIQQQTASVKKLLPHDDLIELSNSQIYNRFDIGLLSDTLALSKTRYLWFCNTCHPFFPETKWVLKHYYPQHLKTYKNNGGFCWLLSKDADKKLIANDFENDVLPFWFWEKYSIDSSNNGNNCQRLDSKNAFGATYKRVLSEFFKHGDTLSIALKIKKESEADVSLVLQAPNFWQEESTIRYFHQENQWTWAFWCIPKHFLPLQNQDSLSFFVWNRGEKKAFIDDVSFSNY